MERFEIKERLRDIDKSTIDYLIENNSEVLKQDKVTYILERDGHIILINMIITVGYHDSMSITVYKKDWILLFSFFVYNSDHRYQEFLDIIKPIKSDMEIVKKQNIDNFISKT